MAGHGEGERLRRDRHRRRPQRPRRRRPAGQGRPARGGARAARRGRRGGHHRDAVGSGLQGHGALLRRQPHAADDPAGAGARAPRLQGPPPGPVLRPAPGRPPPAAARRSRRCGTRRSPSSRPTTPTRMEEWDAWLDPAGRRARPAAVPRPAEGRLEAPGRPARPRPARLAAPRRRRGHGRRPHPAVHVQHRRPASTTTSRARSCKGVLSVSGVIGTWAGPRSPGHRLRHGPPQDRRRRRRQQLGAWGFPEGGMGAVTRRAARGRPALRRRGAGRRAASSGSWSSTAGRPAWCCARARSCGPPVVDRDRRTRRSPSSTSSTATSCRTTS